MQARRGSSKKVSQVLGPCYHAETRSTYSPEAKSRQPRNCKIGSFMVTTAEKAARRRSGLRFSVTAAENVARRRSNLRSGRFENGAAKDCASLVKVRFGEAVKYSCESMVWRGSEMYLISTGYRLRRRCIYIVFMPVTREARQTTCLWYTNLNVVTRIH